MIAVSVKEVILIAIIGSLLHFPIFILVFSEKCIDLHFWGKKYGMTEKPGMFLMKELLVTAAALLLATVLECGMLFVALPGLLPDQLAMLPLPVFAFLTLLLLYRMEQRRFHAAPLQNGLLKRSLGVNLQVTFLFSVLYLFFTMWKFVPVAFDLWVDRKECAEAVLVQVSVAVGLTLLFTALKYIWQKRICRKTEDPS